MDHLPQAWPGPLLRDEILRDELCRCRPGSWAWMVKRVCTASFYKKVGELLGSTAKEKWSRTPVRGRLYSVLLQ